MSKDLHLTKIKGFLIDLDGVLYIGDETIPGAVKAIKHLKSKNIPIRFVTNTTIKSLDVLFGKIEAMNLPIEKDEIISAPKAAALYLKKLGDPLCFFCVNDDIINDFKDFRRSDKDPDYIVIGDIENRWNYDLLNKMFKMIINGAEMIALHKGRYWHQPDGLQLDIGIFIAGLEYVTGKKATVIGKPNAAFFHTSAEDIGLEPGEAVMIGDDIESDVGGAQKAGLKGILVKTGKYRDELVARSSVKPDLVLESIADIVDLI